MPLYPSEPAGGGGTPGGSNTQIQYNNSGSFGGASGWTTNGTVLTGGAGSAATPTLAIGNTTTGPYSVSTTGLGFSINGTNVLDYGISFAGALNVVGNQVIAGATGLTLTNSSGALFFRNQATALSSSASNTFNLGGTQAAGAASAQIIALVTAGATNNTAGNFTLRAGLSTGTATNPDVIFQTGVKTSSGSTVATATTALTIKGETQQVNAATTIATGGYTVATLPAAPPTGSMAYVTDALGPSFLVTVVGGGAVIAPVFYNGTNWVGA